MQEGEQFGPYTLIKRIAFGGMAEIHLAKTSGIGGFEKLLALKVIHPKYSEDQEFIDMLVDEAKIAVQLSHVNICQVFDLGRIEGTYYIALEFIDGKDLYQLLVKCAEKDIPIPLDLVAFIGMEMAAGLQYAHTKSDNYGQPINLIHRDVSPQNVLVSYDGEVKIVDFGIAKAAKRSRETESGVIKGKFFYMSPEQAWGDSIDARTDIFSAGICLYEMLAGEMLYHEEKALMLLDKVRKAEIPNMRVRRQDLPEALERIVLRALSRDRAQRFQSAGELQAALSGFLYGNWPNFNRNRLKEFMQHVFGDQRFVMPRPAPTSAPKAKPNVSGSLMGASDFDPAQGHSVLFDLGRAEAVMPAPRGASPSNRPTTPSRPAPQPARPAVSQAPDASFDEPEPTSALVDPGVVDDDDDDQERTMMEDVWSAAGDDDDKTAILGPEVGAAVAAAVASGNLPDLGDPPTGVFSKEGAPARPSAPAPRAPAPQPAPRSAPAASMFDDSTSMEMSSSDLMSLDATPLSMPTAPKPAAPQPKPAPAPQPAAPQTKPALQPVSRPAPPPTTPLPPPAAPAAPLPAPRPPVNRSAEAARPTMAAMPVPAKKGPPPWLAALVSPRGITITSLVILTVVAVWQLLPMVLGSSRPKAVAVVVESTPPGAKVLLDGQDTGLVTGQTPPARLEAVTPGVPHTLRLSLPGFQDAEEQFTLSPAETAATSEVRKSLFLEKKKGRLEIASRPEKADVFIDGKFACETPCSLTDVDREKNEVKLMLRKGDYRDYSEVVRWGTETAIKVEYQLTPRSK